MRMLLGICILFAGLASAFSGPTPYSETSKARRLLRDALVAITSIVRNNNNPPSSLGSLGSKLRESQEFDYVIVGGGPAGSVMSYRLAAAGFSVALIESGEYREYLRPHFGTIPGLASLYAKSPREENVSDWTMFTEPGPGPHLRETHFPQGRGIGGSTNTGSMVYHRPPASFHDQWAEAVADDSYKLDNFQQFYKKAVTFHPPLEDPSFKNMSDLYDPKDFEPFFEGGPVHVSYPNSLSRWAGWVERALQAVGVNVTKGFNHGNLLGYHYAQMTIRPEYAARSSASEYITKAKKQNLARLKVFTFTEATGLFFERNRTAGVHVIAWETKEKHLIKVRADVILCAGAIKSPQLLLVSGIGPRSVLKEHKIPVISVSNGVGQNLQDHVSFGLSYEVNFETADATLLDTVELEKAFTMLQSSARGVLASNGQEVLTYEKLPSRYRDGFSNETKENLGRLAEDWPEASYISANSYIGNYQTKLFQKYNHKNYATILGTLLSPASRGSVSIRSRDAKKPPVIRPEWLNSRTDKELAVAMFKRIRAMFQSDVLKPIRVGEAWPGDWADNNDDILRVIHKYFFSAGHPASTCKMGNDEDEMAVVDRRARVKGVKGLRVVDASSLPFLPPGYPGATVLAFAEKIALDMIREEREPSDVGDN